MSFIAAPQSVYVFDHPKHVQSWPASTSTGTLNGTMNCRGVSRISARGVLKVRPHTKSGGGGGGAVHFRSDIRKVGGGAIRFRSDMKSGEGGADAFVWHKENTLSLIINGYNFDQGGCSSTSHNELSFLILFIL